MLIETTKKCIFLLKIKFVSVKLEKPMGTFTARRNYGGFVSAERSSFVIICRLSVCLQIGSHSFHCKAVSVVRLKTKFEEVTLNRGLKLEWGSFFTSRLCMSEKA